MTKRAIIVYNPIAKVEPWLLKLVRELCEEADYLVGLFATSSTRTIPDLVHLLERHPDLIIAAGGDGTVRFVLAALARARSDVPLAIVPTGTLNVLARSLGVLDESFFASSLDAALATIRNGKPVPIDLGMMNGKYFAVTAGAGPMSDAFVTPERKAKNLLHHLAYGMAMLRSIAEPPIVFRITADDYTFTVAASGVFISNVLDLGLGRHPDINLLNNGSLFMTIFNPRYFSDFVAVGFRFAGGIENDDVTTYVCKVKEATVEVLPKRSHLSRLQSLAYKLVSHKSFALPPKHREVAAMIDGERCGFTPMYVKVVPSAVTVLVPPDKYCQQSAVSAQSVERAPNAIQTTGGAQRLTEIQRRKSSETTIPLHIDRAQSA